MGRGRSKIASGAKTVSYATYSSMQESAIGLGYGNGGATTQWLNGLSAEEWDAINWYTGGAYSSFNAALRRGARLTPSQRVTDQAIMSAINKYTLTKPTVFHRGSSGGLLAGAQTVDEINAMAGIIVQDDGYTSTSASVGSDFGSFSKIEYHISTPAGTGIGAYIMPVSRHRMEDEFLFRRGSAFRVVGAYEEAGKVHCNLEYVGHN